jgi:nitrogen fixation/metabolism regulation signal transduction histidine kinase
MIKIFDSGWLRLALVKVEILSCVCYNLVMKTLKFLKFRTLQSKLIALFIMIVAIPVVAVSFFSFKLFQWDMEKMLNRSARQSLNQTVNTIDNIITNIIAASNSIILDNDVINILGNNKFDVTNQDYLQGKLNLW